MRTQSIEAFCGDRVHEVLEYLHGHHWKQNRLCSPQELTEVYRTRWYETFHSGVRVPRWQEGEHFQYGLTCLRNYYEENYPFDQARTIALEANVAFQIDNEWYEAREFVGRVDRIAVRRGEIFEIHDYKTGKRNAESLGAGQRQLGLYQYALECMHPEARRIEVFLHFLGTGELFRWRFRSSEIANIVCDWAA